MPRRSLWILFVVMVGSLACYERADRNPYGRWFSEVLETIDRHYLEPVDDQKLFEGALSGMVRKLDDYSSFLSRRETPQFQETIDQQYRRRGHRSQPRGTRQAADGHEPDRRHPGVRNLACARGQDRGGRRQEHREARGLGNRQPAARQAGRGGDHFGAPRGK